jgi:hypothetical protein
MPGRQDQSSYLPLPLQGQCTYEKEDVRVLPVTMPVGADSKILIRPQIPPDSHRDGSYNRIAGQMIGGGEFVGLRAWYRCPDVDGEKAYQLTLTVLV